MAQSNRQILPSGGAPIQENDFNYVPPPHIVNTMNKMADRMRIKMKMDNVGHLKKVSLDAVGSAQHKKILKTIQSSSQLPALTPLRKGCWEYYLAFANGMIIFSLENTNPTNNSSTTFNTTSIIFYSIL